MNPLCEGCGHGEMCTRHKMIKTSRKIEFCQINADTPDGGKSYWVEWEKGNRGATAPENPVFDPPRTGGSPNRKRRTNRKVVHHVYQISTVGDHLQVIIERETGEKIPCSECKAHILQLNSMTIENVRKTRSDTVKQIAERASRNAPKLWQRIAVKVDQAIGIGETDRRIDKWLDEATELAEQDAEKRKLKPVCLTDPVRRNLLYHIYPMTKNRAVWQWNLDQLIRRMDLFTGKRIVGIVTDANSDPAAMVKEYLDGHDIEFLELGNNKKRGEGITFLPMMERIESFDVNEVTFRAHAKGVSKQDREFPVIQKWTEMMYGSCLDDWQTVKSQLDEFAITGPFRRFARMGNADWFYSGSFYWFRNRDVFSRNWRGIHKMRVGIETWPHDLFQVEETGCLFGDNAGSLYQESYTVGKAWLDYQTWTADRNTREEM